MYAFWEYDLYPRLLGGKVEKIESRVEKGNSYQMAYVPSYQGWIRYSFILGDEDGIELLKEIEKAKENYRNEIERVNDTHKARFNMILSKYKKIK